jgi:DNA-binding transcriptional MerR regulator
MEFKSGEMTRITGVKLARLQQWWAAGYIDPPSISVAEGAGTRNVFSMYDLFRILFFKRCVESGLPRETAKEFLKVDEKNKMSLNAGMKVDFENYIKSGDRTQRIKGVSSIYAVFYRKGTKIFKSELAAETDGTLKVSDEILTADDFIGINYKNILIELFENILKQ